MFQRIPTTWCHNPILGCSPNLPKNWKKNKIKGEGFWKKNQGEKFGNFREPDRTSFVPRNERKCRFKAKIIYYWINLRKN